MPSGPTYYEFFGVSRTASAEQIRSAYLWLMKQHHPDLIDQADRERAAGFAALLNRSYDVLKDPQKRANYDAWLDLDVSSRGKRKVRRVLLTGETRRKRESAWDASSKGAAALAGVVVLLLGAALMAPGTSLMHLEAASAETPSSAAAHLDDAAVLQQVRLATATKTDDTERLSGGCFAAARDDRDVAHAEACIVFDDAYLEWNQSAADELSRPAYFNDAVVRLRHRNAMIAAGSLDDGRLMQLRQRTLSVLLREVSSQVSETEQSGATIADTKVK